MYDAKHETVYPCGNWTKIERVENTWVKKTTIIKPLVLESILKFQNVTTYLPEIIKYDFDGEVLTVVTEHVDGLRLDKCDTKTLLNCYGLIYSDFIYELLEFSMTFVNDFFCTDIKPSNFIMGNDRNLYFVDIDSFEISNDIKRTQALYRMSNTFTHLISERIYGR